MIRRAAVGVVCAILSGPIQASGQIAWDTPRLIGPESPSGLGVHWMRAEVLTGDGDALFGTWGLPGSGGAVSVRGGIGKGVGNQRAAFGGVELRAPLARHTDTQPLDLEWSGGAGVGVDEYVLVTVPVSVSAGRSWSSGAVWFAPYVTVGAALDYRLGDSDFAPEEEFEVQATAGLGVDLSFDAARRFVVRAASALGDRQAVTVGLMITGGR
jgi:hypothetical protein